MRTSIIRTLAATAIIGLAGFGGAAIASADTVVEPGTASGAYCTVVSDDGTLTHLQTPAQCLQARITVRMDERTAQQEQDRQDRAADRRADRANG